MKIQSLSVVVPTDSCANDCAFCVSRMRSDEYVNQMNDNKPFYDLYLKDYIRRLEFARDNGCNTVMLTGTGEPQQNRGFLTDFGLFMMLMERPFRNIEMQTTGILLDENYLRFLRNHVGVNTISLSTSALDDKTNAEYNRTKENLVVNIASLCEKIKKYDFLLRLSLNMTDWYDSLSASTLLPLCRNTFGADQVTFRVLYKSGDDSLQQNKWIETHAAMPETISKIREYILQNGKKLEILEYGAGKYSLHGMSIVVDEDCMSASAKQELKYLILRPDCKLYSKWDDPASLVF